MAASGRISSNTDILTDAFKTGKNYTGVTDPQALGGGRYVRYGFLLSQGTGGTFRSADQVILTLNPQSITQSEPAATQITYTQNAGKYIERRGQVSKTISIQGTTGYTPSPVVGDAIRNGLPQSMIIAQEGPASGLAQFVQLRALFRKYWQIFSDDNYIAKRSQTFMVWVNGKEDENWVVEPIDFSMSRASPTNKFTYQYSIQMQTVAPVENLIFDPDPLDEVENVIAWASTAFNDITNAVALIGNTIALVAGAIREAFGIIHNLLTQVAAGLGNIITGVKEVLDLPQSILGQMNDIKNSFMGAWGQALSVADYTAQISGVDPIPFVIHEILANTSLTLAELSARRELFVPNFPQTWAAAVRRYSPSYGVGAYNKDLVTPSQLSGVREVTILPGDTLQTIAVRELGNAERFLELVVLNSLKPPYISPTQADRAPNTLAPGDAILIPAEGTNSGPRAAIRTSVFSDPNFTSVIASFSAPNELVVDTRNRAFRKDQWVGFSVDLHGYTQSSGPSSGGYTPPAGTLTTTLSRAYSAATDRYLLLPQSVAAQLSYGGYLILYDPVSPQPTQFLFLPNLLDAVNPNISTAGDTTNNLSGFVTVADHFGTGLVFDDPSPLPSDASVSVGSTGAEQGSRYIHVETSPTVTGAGFRTASIPVESDRFYTFSFAARGAGEDVNLGFNVVGNDGSTLTGQFPVAFADTWGPRYIYSFYVPPACTQLQVGFTQALSVTPQAVAFDIDALMLAKLPNQSSDDFFVWNSQSNGKLEIRAYSIGDTGITYPAGTLVVFSDDMNLPPSAPVDETTTQRFDGFVGNVASNDADTLKLDTALASGPVSGTIVRIYLQRSDTELVPRKSSEEQLLGVDLRLKDGDLQADATGRVILVDAYANMQQAIETKMAVRPGELPAHPNFGLAFDPGVAISPNLAFTFRAAVRQTLLADARVDSVDQLDVILDRDTLQVSGYVVLAGGSQPYALDTTGAG